MLQRRPTGIKSTRGANVLDIQRNMNGSPRVASRRRDLGFIDIVKDVVEIFVVFSGLSGFNS